MVAWGAYHVLLVLSAWAFSGGSGIAPGVVAAGHDLRRADRWVLFRSESLGAARAFTRLLGGRAGAVPAGVDAAFAVMMVVLSSSRASPAIQ